MGIRSSDDRAIVLTLVPEGVAILRSTLHRCPIEFIDTQISEVLECPILELFS